MFQNSRNASFLKYTTMQKRPDAALSFTNNKHGGT